MRAIATLRNMERKECKRRILRNLSRIMDIRIINIDVDNGLLYFLYASEPAFEKVKQELRRLGYPITSCMGPKPEVGHQISNSTSSGNSYPVHP